MKRILLLTLLLVGFSSYAQSLVFEKPNYRQIEKNIKAEGSPLYYKTLMHRFVSGDSTMTLKEKRHLYYGFSFQDSYKPYQLSGYSDSLRVEIDRSTLDEKALKNIVRLSDSVLIGNPFELRAINYQLYALEQLEEHEQFEQKINQFKVVVDALLSSGNGQTKEDAFYVIYTNHEYALLNLLGFSFGGAQSLVEQFDYLSLADNDAKIEGLYFNVSPCLGSMMKMIDGYSEQ